jgi:hypothetical protein
MVGRSYLDEVRSLSNQKWLREQGCCGNAVTSRNPKSNLGWNWKGETLVEMKFLASLSAGENL